MPLRCRHRPTTLSVLDTQAGQLVPPAYGFDEAALELGKSRCLLGSYDWLIDVVPGLVWIGVIREDLRLEHVVAEGGVSQCQPGWSENCECQGERTPRKIAQVMSKSEGLDVLDYCVMRDQADTATRQDTANEE